MRLEVMPFAAEHLDEAAALLAARHRADRAREPELSARFEEPTAARAELEVAWGMLPPAPTADGDRHLHPLRPRAPGGDGAKGVAAFRNGRLVGYLVGTRWLGSPFLRPRAAWVAYAGHAVTPDEGPETYREVYAALVPRWLAAGCFAQYVTVPAADRQALAAWHSLGFGWEQARGVRDTGPVAQPRPATALEIHQAGAEDIEVVAQLSGRLARYHAGTPIFAPYLPESQAEHRSELAQMLADPERRVLLAYREGRLVGMQTLGPPRPYAAMVTPERCIHLDEAFTEVEARGTGAGTALLGQAMAWARERGYARCTVSWMTANLSGARFWLGAGFRPLQYRLCRVVDERIAWASWPSPPSPLSQ